MKQPSTIWISVPAVVVDTKHCSDGCPSYYWRRGAVCHRAFKADDCRTIDADVVGAIFRSLTSDDIGPLRCRECLAAERRAKRREK